MYIKLTESQQRCTCSYFRKYTGTINKNVNLQHFDMYKKCTSIINYYFCVYLLTVLIGVMNFVCLLVVDYVIV